MNHLFSNPRLNKYSMLVTKHIRNVSHEITTNDDLYTRGDHDEGLSVNEILTGEDNNITIQKPSKKRKHYMHIFCFPMSKNITMKLTNKQYFPMQKNITMKLTNKQRVYKARLITTSYDFGQTNNGGNRCPIAKNALLLN
ncbi:hypothetical protein Lal_00012782, partial [Lupinus albus]